MNRILVACTICVVSLLSGCTQPKQPPAMTGLDAPKSGPATSSSSLSNAVSKELVVNGIALGQGKNEVVALLGEPSKKEELWQQQLTVWTYEATGVTVGFSSDDKVHLLAVSAPSKIRTAKGIGVGSSLDEVRKAYGEAKATVYELEPEVTIRFRLDDQNMISKITVSWQYQ